MRWVVLSTFFIISGVQASTCAHYFSKYQAQAPIWRQLERQRLTELLYDYFTIQRGPTFIALLLQGGAEVNFQNQYGQTSLHLAVEYLSTPQVFNLLLNYGADVNIRNKNGETVLHSAIWHQSAFEIIEILIRHGANLEARDDFGNTPLDIVQILKNNALSRQESLQLNKNLVETFRLLTTKF